MAKTNLWKLNKCLKHIHNTKFYQEIYIMKNISKILVWKFDIVMQKQSQSWQQLDCSHS